MFNTAVGGDTAEGEVCEDRSEQEAREVPDSAPYRGTQTQPEREKGEEEDEKVGQEDKCQPGGGQG